MRLIEDHKLPNGSNTLVISAEDTPGEDRANRHYRIAGFDTATNPGDPFTERYGAPADHATILFQDGPLGETGPNGVTNEALLAVVADRLRSFQNGPYACRENERALQHLEESMLWLQQRTIDRTRRGVEGKKTT